MQFSNNLMSELPILALVFVSVLLVGVVLFPALFRPGKAPRRSVTDMRSLEDPLRRFIAPEELQRMRYSFALVVGLAGVAVVVLTSFLWGFPLVVLVMVMAYFRPKFYYDRKVQRRNQEFENGMLGSNALTSRGHSPEKAGEDAAADLIKEMDSGATMDVHTADQVLPYMAMAGGRSGFSVSRISRHLLSQMDTLESFLDVKFGVERKEDIYRFTIAPGDNNAAVHPH